MGKLIPAGGAFSCSQLQTCAASDLPDWPASKVISGTFNIARIPDSPVSKIPSLPTSKITSGTFNPDRIPYGTVAIPFIIDGGNSVIVAGQKGHIEVPFDAVVTEWRLLAGTVGSIEVDVWKAVYSDFPPSSADSMPGAGNLPTITADRKAESTDLSAWTDTSISKGDIIAFNVSSCGTIERCTLSLNMRRL